MSITGKTLKYATHGAVNAGIFYMQTKDLGSSLTVGGMQIPSYVVAAVVGAGASMISDMAHEYILPSVSGSQRMQSLEGALLGPTVAALSNAAAFSSIGALNDSFNFKTAAMIGAASEVVAVYAYSNIILPQLDTNYKPAAFL